MSIDPFVAITLAQANSDAQVGLVRLHEDNHTLPSGFVEDRVDGEEYSGWKDSPLLELYSVIHETRFKTDRVIGRSPDIIRLNAEFPMKPLAMPMAKVSALKDKRLAWPALMEGGHLMACAFFSMFIATFAVFQLPNPFDFVVSQLSTCASFLRLFRQMLLAVPSLAYEKVDAAHIHLSSDLNLIAALQDRRATISIGSIGKGLPVTSPKPTLAANRAPDNREPVQRLRKRLPTCMSQFLRHSTSRSAASSLH